MYIYFYKQNMYCIRKVLIACISLKCKSAILWLLVCCCSYAGKYGRYAPLKKEEEFDNPFAAALENHEGVELMRK